MRRLVLPLVMLVAVLTNGLVGRSVATTYLDEGSYFRLGAWAPPNNCLSGVTTGPRLDLWLNKAHGNICGTGIQNAWAIHSFYLDSSIVTTEPDGDGGGGYAGDRQWIYSYDSRNTTSVGRDSYAHAAISPAEHGTWTVDYTATMTDSDAPSYSVSDTYTKGVLVP